MNTHEQLQTQSMTVSGLNVTLDASRLICAVYDTVQRVIWPPSGRSLRFDATPDAVMQSLLTYCYAVGTVASDEIEAATRHDPAVRYLCANHAPRLETIREFRRRHVPYLKSSLATLFRLIADTNGSGAGIAGDNYSTFSLERMDRFSPNHTFFTLAAQRLSNAVAADSHALDV